MPFDPTPQTLAAAAPPSSPPNTPPPVSAPALPPPPDITVTREDVQALPTYHGNETTDEDGPKSGNVWALVRSNGRNVWAEVVAGTPPDDRLSSATSTRDDGTGFLERWEADLAERAFVWQTSVATATAWADIGADEQQEDFPGAGRWERLARLADLAELGRSAIAKGPGSGVVGADARARIVDALERKLLN